MEYEDFSMNDFLLDEYFRRWITCPDANTSSFWESWLVQHPEKGQTVTIARQILLVLLSVREEEISEQEIERSWLKLQMALAKQGKLPNSTL